jgi:hypothetical protein
MIYVGGECYEGGFKEGKREGEGILRYPDGTFYKGKVNFSLIICRNLQGKCKKRLWK